MSAPRKQIRTIYSPNQHSHKSHTKHLQNEDCIIEQFPCDVHCQFETKKFHSPEISTGKMIAKIPIVIAELTLQANLNTTITFPEPVLEIKEVKKQMKITQSRLLLPTNKLFIKGVIRKNILYASSSPKNSHHAKTSDYSDLRSLTIDIPIQCMTEIKKYMSKPVMPKINEGQEFEFFDTKPLPTEFSETDSFMSNDLPQFQQLSKQHYNELPYCELVSSKIMEWDEPIDNYPLPSTTPVKEVVFTKMVEKMMVDFTIKVLQYQQVCITSSKLDHEWESDF